MTTRRKVALVELPVFSGVIPLVSGYLEAYCRKDPETAGAYEFEKISLPVKTPYREVLAALERADADVYAFSCYVWNTRLVRRLLDALTAAKPEAHFMLGGPQVMHQAARYLAPERSNVFICNSEGERVFARFLRELRAPVPDFANVRSLSFYRGDELVTTEQEERISDLSEIPSPFLEGVFEKGAYTWVLLETNRGCPFKCNYCYWGAATGSRVYKYDNARIERELEWISQSGCWYLFIADANWGMLPRDVELSRFIVERQKEHGAPSSVYYCGSKNTPDRVAEIARVFHEAGLVACQSVALQTMNEETLRRVDRANIKTSAYTSVQRSLNQQGIASFIEIIWPLPGETLDSFRRGLAQLCELGADSFVVYPLVLMNNVELARKRKEYGLIGVRDPDPNSEAELVVQTAEVDGDAYREGIRYVYAVTALYSLRSLWFLFRYLSQQGRASYLELFQAFVEFTRRQPAHPWTSFCEKSIRALEHVAFANTGALVHLMLHAEREGFDELLESFVTSQGFWSDPVAQFYFELDLVNRPYVYQNTKIGPKRRRFTHLREVTPVAEGYVIELPWEHVERLDGLVELQGDGQATNRFELKHRRAQLPFMQAKSLNEHYMYCQDASQRMRTLAPVWRKLEAVAQRRPLSAAGAVAP